VNIGVGVVLISAGLIVGGVDRGTGVVPLGVGGTPAGVIVLAEATENGVPILIGVV
jgi:hypothetical protein